VDGDGWSNSLYSNFNDRLKFDNRNADNPNSNYAALVAVRPGLLLAKATYPSSEHFSYFLEFALEDEVLVLIYALRLKRDPYE
jgi:hypothetical protein